MYNSDKPILTVKEDLLDRKSFSQILAKSVVELKNTDTFTIGVFGKWGTGKTSVVNMALDEVQKMQAQSKNKTIIVRFEPWHFTDSTQLLTQFFLQFSKEFKKDKKLKKIGQAIEKYSHAFELAKFIPKFGKAIAVFGTWGFKIFGKILAGSTEEQNIYEQKMQVVNLLTKQKSPILVVIDDIDRLSNEQIRQVFQLVSSVAKFPNTTYLLVFDKDIVVKALSEVQEGNGEEYLEKIIQMPVEIPEIQKSKLQATLFERLNKILSKYPNTSFSTEHWKMIFQPCVIPFIKNLRDVNRLCNTINFKLTTIFPEVDFGDMVAISAIEIGVSPIYSWIKRNKHILTQNNSWLNTDGKTNSDKRKFYYDELKSLVMSYNYNTDEILRCLSYLFPEFGNRIGETYIEIDNKLFGRRCQICHPKKFEHYFHLDIDKVEIKRAHIQEAIYTLDSGALSKLLIEKTKSGTGLGFLEEVDSQICTLSSERAKILFKSILFSCGELKSIEQNVRISAGAYNYALRVCLDVLERVISDERKDLVFSVIQDSAAESIEAIAEFINFIELGYGRLAAEGKERNYKKVITLEELFSVENSFLDKIKTLIDSQCIFDFPYWRMTLYLFKSFDSKNADLYLSKQFEINKNILRFLDVSVVLWVGGGEKYEYEIQNKYNEFLTSEKILEAIQQEVATGRIFELPKKILNKCAAFYLYSNHKTNNHGEIDQAEVDDIIALWKANSK